MRASAREAVKHYDDTASALVDVVAGEDQFGIWVAGALRPEATPQQVRALRASAPSGDWRPIGNRLELVAVCAVNVPGFPTVRSMVAGGQITALVAAGARPLAEIRDTKITTLEEKVHALEMAQLSKLRDEALARMEAEEKSHLEAMAASAMKRMEDAELESALRALEARFNS